MIKIYGSPRSSSGRCYLMLEEIGVPYKAVPLDMMEKREHKSEAYLKLNPNGKVPCLIDEDFVIWESMAINFYLAEKYKPELLGKTPQEKGHVLQWSTWSQVELQPPMVDILIQMWFTPEDKRNMSIVSQAQDKIPPMMQILDKALAGKSYLVGEKFTLADINVSSVVNIALGLKFPLDGYENINFWMNRIKERPSFQKFLDLRK